MRRYTPLAPSRGTVIPADLRRLVTDRDRRIVGGNGCVGRYVGMTGPCGGSMELDHVAGSGALGKKSPTVAGNLVTLCAVMHRERTENGRTWRPLLLAYLETAGVA